MNLLKKSKNLFVLTLCSIVAFQPSVAMATAADAAPNPIAGIAQAAGFAASSATKVLFPSNTQEVVADEIGGSVEVRKADSEEWMAVSDGEKFSPEDSIRTGEDGRVRLTFDGKTIIYLTPNSELILADISKKSDRSRNTLLNLKLGRLKAEVNKQQEDSVFKIETPTAVASVRGTILYLNVAQAAAAAAAMMTDLYVDEGIVDFGALSDALDNILVDAFGASSVGGDGSVLPLRRLTPEQRREFIELFDQAYENAGNPQGEVEEQGTGGGNDQDDDSDDALNDKNSEQDTNGQQAVRNRRIILGLLFHSQLNRLSGIAGALDQLDLANTALALAEGPSDSGDWDLVTLVNRFDDGIVSADRLTLLDEIDLLLADTSDELLDINNSVTQIQLLFAAAQSTDSNGGFVSPAISASDATDSSLDQIDGNTVRVQDRLDQLQALRDAEKAALRNRLGQILQDQTELQKQAEIDKATDLQTGKVFTDAFGNRVRVDQYIIHDEGSSSVQFIALTLRTGDYQPGITSFLFQTDFNRALTAKDGLLRNLPWKDYLNVVTREEYADVLEIPEYLFGENGPYRNPEYDALADQYIVHEGQPGIATGENALYPTAFTAEFANPLAGREGRDRILFGETFEAPESVEFDDEFSLPVQAKDGDMIHIMPFGGADVKFTAGMDDEGQWSSTLEVGGTEIGRFMTREDEFDERYQGEDFDSRDISGLADVNGVNDFVPLDQEEWDSSNAPSHFIEQWGYYADEEDYVNHALIGVFLPIDNEGNILPADNESGAGFELNGIRDLVNPNPDVNGGNYNLQTILMYGQENDEGLFEESFRIDAIITPESLNALDSEASPKLFPHQIIDPVDDED